MNARPSKLSKLTEERLRLVAVIDGQRCQIQRAYASLRRPFYGMDRVQRVARYFLQHKTIIWALFTLMAFLRRRQSRRRLVHAVRARGSR